YKICRPRSACGQTYTDFSRCPGITVRRMRRTLLMRSQDVTDLVLVLIQRIIYIQNRTARISEYGIHTLLFSTFYYNFCSCKLHCSSSFRLVFRTLQDRSSVSACYPGCIPCQLTGLDLRPSRLPCLA